MANNRMQNINLTNTFGGGRTTPNYQENKERYNSLDGLRALACIGIVLMHVKSNIALKPTENFLTDNIIDFTGNFVLLFMMVSAFSLCCGYYKRFRDGTIPPQQFYSKRYMRVLPFFAMLVLVDIVMTFLGERAFTDTMIQELAEGFADITLVFGLLPNADIKVIGVGWFLGLIFVFYMLFPFFIYLLDTKRKAWAILVLSVVMFFVSDKYLGGTSRKDIIYCAPYFLSGGIIYLYRHSVVNMLQNRMAYWGYTFLVMAYTIFFFALGEFRLPLFSSLLLYTLWLIYAVGMGNGKTVFYNKIATFLSGISMEVYLCHMMFFRIIEKLHLENRITNGDFNYWIVCLLVLTGAILFSTVWKRYEKRVTAFASSRQ